MGLAIGILALLVIWACVEVGLLYSILAIGIVGGILYAMYALHKKVSQKGPTEQDKKLVSIFIKVIIVISACLIFFGVVLGVVGLLNPETDGYTLQQCGYCGGSGRLTSGKACGLCHGAGGTAYENSIYADYTWLGILMAASGAALCMGMVSFLSTIDTTKKTSSSKPAYVDTTISATPKPISSNNVQHDSISQAYNVYMLIEEAENDPELHEQLYEIRGVVVRGNVYGQQVVNIKNHLTGETAKFMVAGKGLKGKAGDRVCLNIYEIEGGRNITVGDSLYI